jgi:hypothetical protein
MSDQNKALVGRWVDGLWNKGNMAIIDDLGAPELHMYYPLTENCAGAIK